MTAALAALALAALTPSVEARERRRAKVLEWKVEHIGFPHREPDELQFSCFTLIDEDEERLAKQLASGTAAERVAAARLLWRGHSRRHARAVMQLAAARPDSIHLCREVETALLRYAVLRELRVGDYRWGTWLAGLRPHPDLVPELVRGLRGEPEHRPGTVLALGRSGDRRAFAPLVGVLTGGDYVDAGFAAGAVGDLGGPGAESVLVDALAHDTAWVRVNASIALARVGTRRAVPALTWTVKRWDSNIIFNPAWAAADALKAIAEREGR